MSQLGLGAMLGLLSRKPKADESKVLGKRIRAIAILDDDKLVIEVEDGYRIQISDDARSCCESRYMTCDDDLGTYVGATLVSIDVENGPDLEAGDMCHETQFLRISTDLGTIVATTHNVHNGYYGGFALHTVLTGGPDDDATVV